MIPVELENVASVDDARMGQLAGQLVRVALEAVIDRHGMLGRDGFETEPRQRRAD